MRQHGIDLGETEMKKLFNQIIDDRSLLTMDIKEGDAFDRGIKKAK